MSQHTVDRPAVTRRAPASAPRRRHLGSVLLQLTAMAGLGAVLYPAASDWFAVLGHDAEVSGYVRQVEQADTADRRELRAAAQEYNSKLPPGLLRDPYSGVAPDVRTEDYARYEQLLDLEETEVIGEVRYPALGIALPIYHGAEDEVLTRGAGHIYGSSLPVGGPSTHSVLTSHSGLISASLFTPLPDAALGQLFEVSVLGERHFYEVTDIRTVLPEETESLQVVDGADLVTLVTCTPIGINSHRLLVQGVRVPNPDAGPDAVIAGDGVRAGFPWWAVLFLAGSAGTAAVIFSPARSSRKRGAGGGA